MKSTFEVPFNDLVVLSHFPDQDYSCSVIPLDLTTILMIILVHGLCARGTTDSVRKFYAPILFCALKQYYNCWL